MFDVRGLFWGFGSWGVLESRVLVSFWEFDGIGVVRARVCDGFFGLESYVIMIL